MKRLIAVMFLILSVGTACADELADAANSLNSKNYPQALAIYTRLANAGNPEAMLRLGEMYWYGEGAPLDRAKGDALFAQAAAAGNQAAIANTKLTSQRRQRMAEITYWTSGYDGADLVVGKFNCVAPTFPPFSETKRAVTAMSATSDAYTACYNAFIENLESALPAGKRIPEEVALLMSEQELNQAREHLVKVYAAVAARGKLSADQVVAKRAEWMIKTTDYLTTQKLREQQYLAQMEAQRVSNIGAMDIATRAVPVSKPSR
jgi:TPR repeat protein